MIVGMATKPIKLTNNDKAALRVVAAITKGLILTAYAPLTAEETTVGPYNEAIDRGIRFATIGWATKRVGACERRTQTAQEAADIFVGRVGSTRAREAAIEAEKKYATWK